MDWAFWQDVYGHLYPECAAAAGLGKYYHKENLQSCAEEKLLFISNPLCLKSGFSPGLVCVVSTDRTKHSHQAAGLGSCLTVPPSPVFLFPFLTYSQVIVRTHTFCCHNGIWHINNSAEQKKPSAMEGTLEQGWSRWALFWHTLLINTKWWEWGMMLHWRSQAWR